MIEVKNLTFSYVDDKPVLKNISFQVNDGEWISILGHNGSGKSTLAKLLIGLYEASSGEIIFTQDGVKKTLNPETVDDIRKHIGIVFQNPDNQFVGVTVKHDIAFGLENRQVPRDQMEQKILEVAKIVGMEDFLDKEPQQLSGGQKQRVAIAGAVAMDLDIIIFDEATSMLDPEGTEEIVKLIRLLNKEYKKTVISITHDLAFADLSDRLIVLRAGEKILEGTPREVFKEEELLKSSNLELPFAIKLENELQKSEFKDKEQIINAICKYNSRK